MSRVFIDTSAILALLVQTDAKHKIAVTVFRRLESQRAQLVTSSYVLVESYALLGRRFGLQAVRQFRDTWGNLLEVVWVTQATHDAALDTLLKSGIRELSLVDCVSFEVVRTQNIDEAFAFDAHFQRAGVPVAEP